MNTLYDPDNKRLRLINVKGLDVFIYAGRWSLPTRIN